MRIKSIGIKLLIGILPPIMIAMALLIVISASRGRIIISQQTEGWMTAELAAQKAKITNEMTVISSTAQNVAGTVSNGYKSMTPYNLETSLQQVVTENNAVYGSGIWFEANAFKPSEKYMGPYVHRNDKGQDGKKEITLTYDRSTVEYDYLNQAFYLLGSTVETPVFTSPYYEEESGKMLVTCVAPMYNVIGNFIGCVTVDMDMSMMQDMVAGIRIGEEGDAMLLDGNTGAYLGCADAAKTAPGAGILQEKNGSIVQAGNTMLAQESGIAGYQDETEDYILYFDTIPAVNWKLAMRVPQSQLDAPVTLLVEILTAVGGVAAIVCIVIVLLHVRMISGSVRKVQKFAATLADGDFSVPNINIRSKDELGQMGNSLNAMYNSNKEVLLGIARYAERISMSSEDLSGAAKELSARFADITGLMNGVNDAMIASSSATEQVNASSVEVSSSVNVLSEETRKSMDMTETIQEKAGRIEKDSRDSYAYATRLSGEYEENLNKSIQNAAVVESIGKMAEVISGIAEEINLLSLNASIEAARAGEQGRGFAVVATQIGKMAVDTSKAVEEIQTMIGEVRSAFALLISDSKSLVAFLRDTVTPDYDKFVGVAKEYGTDAEEIQANSTKISIMASNIEKVMGEVSGAVQNIADSTRDTASSSGRIMDTMEQVSRVMEKVSDMSQEHKKISGSLNEVVGKFRLQ